MPNIFAYDFMIRAFIVASCLSLIIPMIGMVIVLKRLSMIGDALSHTSLAGVTAGLAFGFNPVVGAVIASLLSAFGIEYIRKRLPNYSELSIAITMSFGLALAGILSGLVKNATGFSSFLFGSIVAISSFELYFVTITALLVFLILLFFYEELFFIAIDERGAKLMGVPVKFINAIFTALTAITISIASRTVGALMVSSLMVIPVAVGINLANSYKKASIIAVLTAFISCVSGLTLSFYFGLKPGATIVSVSIVIIILSLFIRRKNNE